MLKSAVLCALMCITVGAEAGAHMHCRDQSPELEAAEQRFARLKSRVGATKASAPVAPLRKELEGVIASRCFEFAKREYVSFDDATTPSLKAWWHEGGESWLRTALKDDRELAFPPDVRNDLARSKSSAVHRLLCAPDDEQCAAATAGWRERAEQKLRALAEGQLPFSMGYTGNVYERAPASRVEPTSATDRREDDLDRPLWACAHPKKGQLTYDAWHECVSVLRSREELLPVGAIKAPSEGWLVIRGRRGHYHFCDGVTAYHLATGAYYAAKSCSGLALNQDGTVDGAKTDDERHTNVEMGRLSVDNLRELAWMLLIAEQVEQGYANEQTFPLPPGLVAKFDDDALGGIGMGGFGGSSAQTQLTWTWIIDGKTIAQGHFTWPDSYRASETHADELLRVAEKGRVDGCPTVPLSALQLGCSGGVSRIDASASSLCVLQDDLQRKLLAAKCR